MASIDIIFAKANAPDLASKVVDKRNKEHMLNRQARAVALM